MIDVDDIRNPHILLHELSGADGTYTFYHDETNNIRKLHIAERGLNVEKLKVFVLGGIVHEGSPRFIDIGLLRQAMGIQKSTKEIKLKHIAKGDFLDLLHSERLSIFLKWIIDNGFILQYHSLDPLYWSVVDIIDSILPFLNDAPALIPGHALLKSDLNEVVRKDLSAAIDIFRRYNYPDVSPENGNLFLDELIALVERNDNVLSELHTIKLIEVLQAGKKLEHLEFIEGFSPHKLIESFSYFYQNRIAIFKYSAHIIDMESIVQNTFADRPLTEKGKPVTNYRFEDSATEVGIQISDIIVGVLGKMHTYLSEASANKVAKDRLALTGIDLKNTELLRDLIETSDNANKAFLHHVASLHDINKLDLFLHFSDGKYA
ncbi:MAG: hypothetical protein COV66_05505 [Nitrospinae bacterium CG11_big_fil_rev_8_21_14_0_20_45_15]|nr:MAG: hypothetical protein COV66_05505 [Nitrospinae bacterium CG11_big_fil_rev_8_21_14_0_20_45_15]